jgi:hypothetical protein
MILEIKIAKRVTLSKFLKISGKEKGARQATKKVILGKTIPPMTN